MDILIVAIEQGRWGPARLPCALRSAGLSVAALCPKDNALHATDHLDRRLEFPKTRSAKAMGRALADALRAVSPRLVIPADEQVVALFHFFIRTKSRWLSADQRDLLTRSLGPEKRFDAMLMKSKTLSLARQLGVEVPRGDTIQSAVHAIDLASAIGYPVYVKRSFGWSGAGVVKCNDPAALGAAIAQDAAKPSAARAAIRRMLHRDWFPIDEAVDVQSAVAGTNAMYCALAWQGRLVAGFAGVPLATASESGPSTAVRLGPHLGMAEASRQLLAAMGATGFIGFDFILDEKTDRPILLECNPRPIQVCHLGHRVGVDLGKALAATMAGQTAPEMSATGFAEVVLFPHAFVRAAHPAAYYDIPADDVGLRRFASQQSEP